MKSRRGFTLIELLVSMVILLIILYMALSSFSFVNRLTKSNQDREAVLENISTVLDQITKELRQTYTYNDGTGQVGITYPTYSSSSDTLRDITTISTPSPPLSNGQYYLFGAYDTDPNDDPMHPILQFYIVDNTDPGTKHRISYTLGVPNDGNGFFPPHYRGIPREYWADNSYEPCEILYSNETWNGSTWVGIQNQPITDQVITNFSVIRPKWSNKVIQIVIEEIVKDSSGRPMKITRIATVTLRQ